MLNYFAFVLPINCSFKDKFDLFSSFLAYLSSGVKIMIREANREKQDYVPSSSSVCWSPSSTLSWQVFNSGTSW